jgi:hypothetical protein
MTQARRPDGSGGPLSEDERIDDIQFYIAPDAELLIDDIVLYDAAPKDAKESFPRRVIFTGWFDTGQQGKEWPGDFEIVKHELPLTWKAAKSVVNLKTGEPWIRVHLRGQRPLSPSNRLRFRYRLNGATELRVVLAKVSPSYTWNAMAKNLEVGRWAEATVDFDGGKGALADEIRFLAAKGAELLVDNLLLYEPGVATPKTDAAYWIEPMKKVHARFTGAKGTFAHFGDSITVSMAFWAPLAGDPKDMSPEMAEAHRLVKRYLKPECWSRWKGPEFGNNGSMTVRWARENVNKWLAKLNPEVVLVMFGSNDVGQMDVVEYELKTREVVQRCLAVH